MTSRQMLHIFKVLYRKQIFTCSGTAQFQLFLFYSLFFLLWSLQASFKTSTPQCTITVPALKNSQGEALRASGEKLVAEVWTDTTFAASLPGHPAGHASFYLDFAHTVLSLTWDLHMPNSTEFDHFSWLPVIWIALDCTAFRKTKRYLKTFISQNTQILLQRIL